MKSNYYRLSLVFLLLISTGFDAYLLYLFITNNSNENGLILNILAMIVIIIFTVFEIFLLFKGLSKDHVIIHDLVYEGEELNKPSFIINNVLLGIGFVSFIVTLVCAYYIEGHFFNLIVISPIFLYLFINCVYYDAYILLYKSIKKDEYEFFISKK